MTGVLLVTGGSRGIGAAVARLGAARGYAVAVNYANDAAGAHQVVDAIEAAGGRAVAVRGDVSGETEVERMFEAVDRELGPLTALVNNAGITGRMSRLDEASPDTMRRVIDVNVNGVLFCSQQAVKRMSTRYDGAGGAIVNISSAAATLGAPGEFLWYAASKGAVDTITVGLAKELARESIRVNAVVPGLIDTSLHAAAGAPDRVERLAPMIPMGRAGSAEEVAEVVLFLLSDAAAYVTGERIRVAGGR